MKQKVIVLLFLGVLSGIFCILTLRYFTNLISKTKISPLEDAPSTKVAIVFGAGLQRNGKPTTVLRDRVETASKLYQSGKVAKLLMSGDNRTQYYNEPAAMKEFAIELGVPSEDIVLDFAGWRTYDTCYRAKAIFGVDEALLVTQAFHLPRALITCSTLGIKSHGVAADNRQYRLMTKLLWNLRETAAVIGAYFDLFLIHPIPILGKPEPIIPIDSL